MIIADDPYVPDTQARLEKLRWWYSMLITEGNQGDAVAVALTQYPKPEAFPAPREAFPGPTTPGLRRHNEIYPWRSQLIG